MTGTPIVDDNTSNWLTTLLSWWKVKIGGEWSYMRCQSLRHSINTQIRLVNYFCHLIMWDILKLPCICQKEYDCTQIRLVNYFSFSFLFFS